MFDFFWKWLIKREIKKVGIQMHLLEFQGQLSEMSKIIDQQNNIIRLIAEKINKLENPAGINSGIKTKDGEWLVETN